MAFEVDYFNKTATMVCKDFSWLRNQYFGSRGNSAAECGRHTDNVPWPHPASFKQSHNNATRLTFQIVNARCPQGNTQLYLTCLALRVTMTSIQVPGTVTI